MGCSTGDEVCCLRLPCLISNASVPYILILFIPRVRETKHFHLTDKHPFRQTWLFPHFEPINSFIHSAVSMEHRLVTNRHTRWVTAISACVGPTLVAYASRGNNLGCWTPIRRSRGDNAAVAPIFSAHCRLLWSRAPGTNDVLGRFSPLCSHILFSSFDHKLLPSNLSSLRDRDKHHQPLVLFLPVLR